MKPPTHKPLGCCVVEVDFKSGQTNCLGHRGGGIQKVSMVSLADALLVRVSRESPWPGTTACGPATAKSTQLPQRKSPTRGTLAATSSIRRSGPEEKARPLVRICWLPSGLQRKSKPEGYSRQPRVKTALGDTRDFGANGLGSLCRVCNAGWDDLHTYVVRELPMSAGERGCASPSECCASQ